MPTSIEQKHTQPRPVTQVGNLHDKKIHKIDDRTILSTEQIFPDVSFRIQGKIDLKTTVIRSV